MLGIICDALDIMVYGQLTNTILAPPCRSDICQGAAIALGREYNALDKTVGDQFTNTIVL